MQALHTLSQRKDPNHHIKASALFILIRYAPLHEIFDVCSGFREIMKSQEIDKPGEWSCYFTFYVQVDSVAVSGVRTVIQAFTNTSHFL